MEGSTLETQPSMPWEAAPEMSPEGCDDDLFPPAPELAPIRLNERMLRERLRKISVLSASGNLWLVWGKLVQKHILD